MRKNVFCLVLALLAGCNVMGGKTELGEAFRRKPGGVAQDFPRIENFGIPEGKTRWLHQLDSAGFVTSYKRGPDGSYQQTAQYDPGSYPVYAMHLWEGFIVAAQETTSTTTRVVSVALGASGVAAANTGSSPVYMDTYPGGFFPSVSNYGHFYLCSPPDAHCNSMQIYPDGTMSDAGSVSLGDADLDDSQAQKISAGDWEFEVVSGEVVAFHLGEEKARAYACPSARVDSAADLSFLVDCSGALFVYSLAEDSKGNFFLLEAESFTLDSYPVKSIMIHL